MNNFFKPGDYIDYTNAGSAIAAGDIVVTGDLIGVAVNDIAASNGVGPVLIRGIVKITKPGSQAWTQGQTVFYSGSNTFTTVATANSRAGVAAFAVGSGAGDTTGYVLLNTTPGIDLGDIQAHIADPASAAAMTQDTITDSTTGTPTTTLAAAKLTGSLTGTANGALVDVAATAGACEGSTTPTATHVDAAIARAVASIVSGVNEQNVEIQAMLTVHANALASIAAQLAKIKTDVAAVRTGSEANNTAIDSINAALAAFKVTAAS
jgi:predicted RecA/RadA family phage recombinase